MADANGVLIVGEATDEGLAVVTGELLGVGRKLADSLGQELSVLFMGSGISFVAAEAFAQGADKVHVADDPLLKVYQPDSFTTVLQNFCQEQSPNVVVLGTTLMGRDLAPKLACRLETGLATDCTGLNIDPDSKALIGTRPVYGAKALADVDCGTVRPVLATVRIKSQVPLEPDSSRTGTIIPVAVSLDASQARSAIVDTVIEAAEGIKLEDARIVIGGGRGLGSLENWRRLEELAYDLKGAIGSTRGACDEGYCAIATQLGITAKTIAPELYMAVGISGASQHMAGVAFSKYIVAVNKDDGAPVFKGANFGAVGRWEEIIPAFHAKVKELLAE